MSQEQNSKVATHSPLSLIIFQTQAVPRTREQETRILKGGEELKQLVYLTTIGAVNSQCWTRLYRYLSWIVTGSSVMTLWTAITSRKHYITALNVKTRYFSIKREKHDISALNVKNTILAYITGLDVSMLNSTYITINT